jgi:hypothetical protein
VQVKRGGTFSAEPDLFVPFAETIAVVPEASVTVVGNAMECDTRYVRRPALARPGL